MHAQCPLVVRALSVPLCARSSVPGQGDAVRKVSECCMAVGWGSTVPGIWGPCTAPLVGAKKQKNGSRLRDRGDGGVQLHVGGGPREGGRLPRGVRARSSFISGAPTVPGWLPGSNVAPWPWGRQLETAKLTPPVHSVWGGGGGGVASCVWRQRARSAAFPISLEGLCVTYFPGPPPTMCAL